jgi:protein phosphatase PTC7
MPPPAHHTAVLLAATTFRPPRSRTRLLLLLPRAARLYSSSPGPRRPAFRYHAAASVSAKTDPLDLARNTYEHARPLAGKPWPPRGGHDAFFLSDAPAARSASGNSSGGPGGGADGRGEGDAGGGDGDGGVPGLAFGVADGVGGWVDSGVDPADFSRRLCRNMARAAAAGAPPSSPPAESLEWSVARGAAAGGSAEGRAAGRRERRLLRPVELLEDAYARVLADPGVWAGGSTACVATASPEGVLEVAKFVPPLLLTQNVTDDWPPSLGDSGYVHVSPFRLSHLSSPQTHTFNAPFQLSKIPRRMRTQMRLFGGYDADQGYYRASGGHYEEQPRDADVHTHAVAHGDVIVLATDGVWDNLAARDVLRAVCGVMVRRRAWLAPADGDGGGGGGGGLATVVAPDFAEQAAAVEEGLAAMLAAKIVREAKVASLDTRRDGPFAKEVRRWYPHEGYTGGKPDDICVVVVVVVGDNEA